MAITKKKPKSVLDDNPFPEWLGDVEYLLLPEFLRKNADLLKGFKLFQKSRRFKHIDMYECLCLTEPQYRKYREVILKLFNRALFELGITEHDRDAFAPEKGARTFSADCLPTITACAMANFDAKRICLLLGISNDTWNYWQKSKSVHEAIIHGQEMATAKVVKAVFRKAVGYSHPESKMVTYQGNYQEVKVMKHYPPDMVAAEMYLMNHLEGWKSPNNPGTGFSPDALQTEYDVRSRYYEEDANV